MSKKLKPCPCGAVPTELSITEGSTHRWRTVQGDCCGEWMIEARVPTMGNKATPEGQEQACIDSWNQAQRSKPNE